MGGGTGGWRERVEVWQLLQVTQPCGSGWRSGGISLGVNSTSPLTQKHWPHLVDAGRPQAGASALAEHGELQQVDAVVGVHSSARSGVTSTTTYIVLDTPVTASAAGHKPIQAARAARIVMREKPSQCRTYSLRGWRLIGNRTFNR